MDKEQLSDKLADIVPEKTITVRNTKCCKGCPRHINKLHVYDWLHDFPELQAATKMVEVQFKNTRKGYYINSNDLELHQGDLVAVEAIPGHDIGTVTLTGKLVELQMKKNNFRDDANGGLKRVYRIARPADLEKYEQAKAREQSTMIRSREIAEELGLQMKIGDVEYQGDGNKAIFYYIADERVDFRQLIKVLAGEFRVKIEMKQIGARQEAGRIGGLGACGREMCCSSWMSSFISVSTSAARCQDISINPQKLAGQCGKLKCCMNYEVDQYVEAQRGLPSREIVLETKDSDYYHFKTDIFAGMITYSTDKYNGANLETISKERVFEIITMNKKGKKPLKLAPESETKAGKEGAFIGDVLEDQSITRFDGNLQNQTKKEENPVKGVLIYRETEVREITDLPVRTKHKISFFFIGVALSFLISCSEGEVYYRFHHIDKGKWYRDSFLVFKTDSADFRSGKKYDISVEVSINHVYPYRDLWIHIDHNLVDSIFRRDTLQCYLADEYGKWLGSGVGGLNQLSFPYLSSVSLDTTRRYELTIGHAMSDDPLIGIEKVGLKVIEVNVGKL
jgi:gliding motility-associated lipoprotein GldH